MCSINSGLEKLLEQFLEEVKLLQNFSHKKQS